MNTFNITDGSLTFYQKHATMKVNYMPNALGLAFIKTITDIEYVKLLESKSDEWKAQGPQGRIQDLSLEADMGFVGRMFPSGVQE